VLSPVERALGVLPQLPAWPAAGVGGGGAPAAGGAMVPQFSAYPLAVVTGGEWAVVWFWGGGLGLEIDHTCRDFPFLKSNLIISSSHHYTP
jgi:hypothetical protein